MNKHIEYHGIKRKYQSAIAKNNYKTPNTSMDESVTKDDNDSVGLLDLLATAGFEI